MGGLFFEKDLVTFPDIMRCLLVLIFMAFGFTAVSRGATDQAEALVAGRRLYELATSTSAIDALGEGGGAVSAASLPPKTISLPEPPRDSISSLSFSAAEPVRVRVRVKGRVR